MTSLTSFFAQATPGTPPVVTGAGVVVVTKEDGVPAPKVLLKRYKTSLAFVGAAQNLAFLLRRAGELRGNFEYHVTWSRVGPVG